MGAEKLGHEAISEIDMMIGKYEMLKKQYTESGNNADARGVQMMWWSAAVSSGHIIEDLKTLKGRIIEMEEET